MRPQRIRLLVIDDSPTKRDMLVKIINSHPDMVVISQALNGLEGVEKNKQMHPDVIIMDIKMPVMDGLTATKKIMETSPVPILIISSTGKSQVMGTLDALSVGAVDFIAVREDMEVLKEELYRKIKIAAETRVIKLISHLPKKISTPLTSIFSSVKYKLVAIGVSTGGPTALLEVLKVLPRNFPLPIVIVQHMIAGFTEGLAEWLNNLCEIVVKEAKLGERLAPGIALIAPGGYNLTINSLGAVILKEIPEHSIYQPSVDEMMKSVSKVFQEKTIGVILTGMGKDGAEGIKEIKKCGGYTIAQDESTSIVWGMPKVAIELNCIDQVLKLSDIGQEIINICGVNVKNKVDD